MIIVAVIVMVMVLVMVMVIANIVNSKSNTNSYNSNNSGVPLRLLSCFWAIRPHGSSKQELLQRCLK